MKTEKNQVWSCNKEITPEKCGEGVERKILAYTDRLMCVENYFKKGGIGISHHHPHTQITYVVSGQFEFTIGDEKKIVNPGDSMLNRDSVEHGCVCLKEGILLDIFSPMREDFVNGDEKETKNPAQEGIDPRMMAFFDTDNLDEKYNILVSMRDSVDNRMIDNMAVSLDVVIPDGDIDTRYEELKRCVRTKQRYESDRLR